MHPDFKIRVAHLAEINELNVLIKDSANALSKGFYSQPEIDALNQYVFGADKELIHDGTYFVIEYKNTLAACGGWSKRRTLFGGDQCDSRLEGYLDPNIEPAKIRAFFIHPDFARQGLGTALLEHCENQAKQSGFGSIELMATLPGVPFYEKQGFIARSPFHLHLPNELEIKLLPMEKRLLKFKSACSCRK